jgi:hypothetical protein
VLAKSVQLNREALELCQPGHPDRQVSLRGLALALSEKFNMKYIQYSHNEYCLRRPKPVRYGHYFIAANVTFVT